MNAFDQNFSEIWRLKNGEQVQIRPVQARDAPFLEQAFAESSRESLHNRFLDSRRGLSQKDLAIFTDFDPEQRFALAAGLYDGKKMLKGVGIARWMRNEEDPLSAEFAVIIIDAYQGQGLGKHLVQLLIASAKAHGLERLRGTLLPYNTVIQKLLKGLGPARFRHIGGGEMEVVLELSEF